MTFLIASKATTSSSPLQLNSMTSPHRTHAPKTLKTLFALAVLPFAPNVICDLNLIASLQNIPAELYEAAKVDGANTKTIFTKITMPYMLFVTTPYLIQTFVGNINNFNVIYLLTGGDPTTMDYQYAGKTDLLITWLYKLSMSFKEYNVASVIGILVFAICATLSLVVFRNTGAYNNEEEFQ